jgi:predicted O-linked N-acetylglucosamine transferase (SPINDLY family)
VGLVSGDFYDHAVSHFLENILVSLNNTMIELIAYSNTPKEDGLTQRIKKYFKGWRVIFNMSDHFAAELIYKDGIHILMDLSGHTAKNRLPLFSYKAAPIQVSWLGYWATTGVAEIDYIFVDKIGVPRQNQKHFTEKIYYLPETRLCFSAPKIFVPVSPLPALNKHYITFGCFQNLSKLTDETLIIWEKIISQFPKSHLRFQSRQLNDQHYCEDFYLRLVGLGIKKDQVSLHAASSRRDYLTAHSEIDFILDTFPFTGGTTTCEALWMGVPTLTLAGDTLVSRQGASLLFTAGLSDWIANSIDDYINKACYFAIHLEELAKLRGILREQVLSSPLFNGQRFSQNFEKSLWDIWDKFELIKR